MGADKKSNNTYFMALSKHFKEEKRISEGFLSLVYFNDMLLGLESLGVCEYSKNCINYIEEKFCYENIQAQQDGFIYYTLGAIGVLLVAIGLNKISVFTGLAENEE